MKLNTKEFDEKMSKTILTLEGNFDTIRAGLANAAVLNRVSFEYYGSPTPLNSMADIRATDSRTLVIKPYDASTLKAMEKAILASDVGITPTNDGSVIRLAFPQLTEERRKELCRQVSKFGEEAKVAIRNIRRDANDLIKKMKKDSEMTEDEEKASEKSVQDLTDKYIKMVDAAVTKKQADIMVI
ncbi:MAG: ribosome recycling factor [Clostridia bacterium]|nr:ribosome recycling factor [Clostridia bacterium]MDD7701228.1 ribosome recycling factor [Eubacteriales bacterium]MDY2827539.1 ribosome recycling factor [Eubacteriales bacterium]